MTPLAGLAALGAALSLKGLRGDGEPGAWCLFGPDVMDRRMRVRMAGGLPKIVQIGNPMRRSCFDTFEEARDELNRLRRVGFTGSFDDDRECAYELFQSDEPGGATRLKELTADDEFDLDVFLGRTIECGKSEGSRLMLDPSLNEA